MLERARAGLVRLSPHEVAAAASGGALLVDIRPAAQRRAHGGIPGAVVIERTVLEWRLDPTSPNRVAEVTDHDRHVVVICQQGYSSSLAAASLQQLGLHRATDLAGGADAWVAAGLPLTDGSEPAVP